MQPDPFQYKVTCPKNGCMRDMCEALSKLVSSSTSATSSQIPPDRMVVTDVYNHRFHKVYGPGSPHILSSFYNY